MLSDPTTTSAVPTYGSSPREKAVAALVAMLDHPDPYERRAAAEALLQAYRDGTLR